MVLTKAGLEPVVCIGEVACLWHYRLDPIVHRETVGEEIRIFKKACMLTRQLTCWWGWWSGRCTGPWCQRRWWGRTWWPRQGWQRARWGWTAGGCSRSASSSAPASESPLDRLQCRTPSGPWESQLWGLKYSEKHFKKQDHWPVVDELHVHGELGQVVGGGGVDNPVDFLHLFGQRKWKRKNREFCESHQSPLESVVLGGGAIGVDDQLTGLVVKRELAEVLQKNGGRKKGQNVTWRTMKRQKYGGKKRLTMPHARS